MSTAISGLEAEMALRGWTQEELARKAGIAIPTANAAVNGRRVSARTAYKIGLALERHKPLASLSGLVEREAS